jgi:hypothetical protein
MTDRPPDSEVDPEPHPTESRSMVTWLWTLVTDPML